MPYHDQHLGTQSSMIVTELACRQPQGGEFRSVTAIPLPYTWPESLPATY